MQESNKADFSMLGTACRKDDLTTFKYLLEESGACHDLSDHKYDQRPIADFIGQRQLSYKTTNAQEISKIFVRYKNNTGGSARGYNLNSEKNVYGERTAQFRRALANNDEKQVAKLLDEGVPPDWIMPDTRGTFLHWAIATKKSVAIVNLLLSKQPNLRVNNINCKTPILLAAKMQDWDTVLVLGKHKQKGRDYSDVNGEALVEAVKANAEKTVKELAEAGAIIQNICLFEAITKRNRDMVLLLLSYNADLQSRILTSGNQYVTPIMMAAELKQWEIVKTIADHKKTDKSDTADYRFALSATFEAVGEAYAFESTLSLIAADTPLNCSSADNGNTPLHWAIVYHNEALLKLLLILDADLTLTNKEGLTPIEIATKLMRWNLVAIIVAARRTDADDKACYAYALQYAMEQGLSIIAKALLEAGTPTHTDISANGNTLLHWAIEHKISTVLPYILKCPVNRTHWKNNNKQTAIEFAASRNEWSIVASLVVQHKTDANDKMHYGQALLYAAKENKLNEVKMLLEAGAPTNTKIAKAGSTIPEVERIAYPTALHWAVYHKNLEMITLLLDHDADLTIKGKFNELDNEPMTLAVQLKQWDIVKLIAGKRPTDVADGANYGNALLEAIKENDTETALALVRAGTPLHWVIQHNNIEILKHLLQHGADLKLVDNKGRTPLEFALHEKKWPIAKIIIEKIIEQNKANSPVVDDDYFINPFCLAAKENQLDIVELIGNGAKVVSISNNNATTNFIPLHWAVLHNNIPMIQFLLWNSACLTLKNDATLTPIHYAATLGHWDAVQHFADYFDLTDQEDKAQFRHALRLAIKAQQLQTVAILLDKGPALLEHTLMPKGYTPLHWAIYFAEESDTTLVEFLLEQGANLQTTTGSSGQQMTAIELASTLGKWYLVKLIAEYQKTDSEDKARFSGALIKAIDKNESAIIPTLLAAGVAIDHIDAVSGWTPLCRAIQLSKDTDSAIVKLLLAQNASLEQTVKVKGGDKELTPIELAADLSKWHLVTMIALHKKADQVNLRRYYGTVLLRALQYGKYDIASTLLTAGASVDCTTPNARATALHLAIHDANYDINLILQLLACGASPINRYSAGMTPLELAIKQNKWPPINMIIAHTAQGNKISRDSYVYPFYERVLPHAIEQHAIETMNLLLDAGIDVDTVLNRQSLLHLALAVDDSSEVTLSMVTLLVERNANLAVKDAKGKTAIMVATDVRKWPAVSIIAGGRQTDLQDDAGYGYALKFALLEKKDGIAEELLKAGTSINSVSPETGYTLTHTAIAENHGSMLKFLLRHKPDLTRVDKASLTPIDLACQRERWDMVIAMAQSYTTDKMDKAHYGLALRAALSAKKIAVMEELLKASAPIDNLPEGNILSLVVASNDQEAIALLRQHTDNWSDGIRSELHSKYLLLRTLQDDVATPKWRGEKVVPFFSSVPDGIELLQKQLSALPSVCPRLEDAWHLIEIIYSKCRKTLERKKPEYKGLGTRGTKASQFYGTAFTNFKALEQLYRSSGSPAESGVGVRSAPATS